ncbi:MAG: hypothetical protein KC438_08655 [Thermomicrobiales bacterium]|nr:hypothetical protein [Thermomicrobiales bacterium]
MDQQTFDRLTRAIATGQNRRSFIRRLFGIGAATVAGTSVVDSSLAAPAIADTLESTQRFAEPTEPRRTASAPQSTETCAAPLVVAECGCIDPTTQSCCRNDICSGVCTAGDGCCNDSADTSDPTRGEVCGNSCCHPYLDSSTPGYSECCGGACCDGHCYGEQLCCAIDQFCPGIDHDLCCGAGERCCGAGTSSNSCIPAGDESCCSVTECFVAPESCYVSCEAGFCRQHYCDDGAVCCGDSIGNVACVAGNCCNDAYCAAGEACLAGVCTAVECFVDTDCTAGEPCTTATCDAGICTYVSTCTGECSVCVDGVCTVDDSVCGLCGVCDAGACIPIECPEGFSCYPETGECLGIA